ncbi:MAG: hypothetical protein IJH38_06155 [Clostridia bacterium]|nr:hypothetical protein [Clostridia bacterium]
MQHFRKILAVVLVLLLAGSAAALAASGTAGYISKKTYVYKKASTSSARVSVAVNTKVYVVGAKGRFYKVRNAKKTVTGYVLKTCVSKTKVSVDPQPEESSSDTGASTSWKSKVVKLDWFKGGSSVLKRGGYGYLYDIASGITLRIKRMGGTNHADVEPATASDTAKLKRIAGGKFSWNTYAAILRAGGKYVACSINTMPHGSQTIRNNNYNGQFCLHMVNSLTHGSTSINQNHQACIEKAYAWAH